MVPLCNNMLMVKLSIFSLQEKMKKGDGYSFAADAKLFEGVSACMWNVDDHLCKTAEYLRSV